MIEGAPFCVEGEIEATHEEGQVEVEGEDSLLEEGAGEGEGEEEEGGILRRRQVGVAARKRPTGVRPWLSVRPMLMTVPPWARTVAAAKKTTTTVALALTTTTRAVPPGLTNAPTAPPGFTNTPAVPAVPTSTRAVVDGPPITSVSSVPPAPTTARTTTVSLVVPTVTTTPAISATTTFASTTRVPTVTTSTIVPTTTTAATTLSVVIPISTVIPTTVAVAPALTTTVLPTVSTTSAATSSSATLATTLNSHPVVSPTTSTTNSPVSVIITTTTSVQPLTTTVATVSTTIPLPAPIITITSSPSPPLTTSTTITSTASPIPTIPPQNLIVDLNTEYGKQGLTRCQYDIVLKITSVIETSSANLGFSVCGSYNDGQGFSAGFIQFTTASGSALQVVKSYLLITTRQNPPLASLVPALERAWQIGNQGQTTGPGYTEGLTGFCDAWREANLNDAAAMQNAQLKIQSEWYLAPNKVVVDRLGLKTALGVAQLMDTGIQLGYGAMLEISSRAGLTPKDGSSEEDYLRRYLDARVLYLMNMGGAYTGTRYRVNSYRYMLDRGNLNFVGGSVVMLENGGTPMTITCY
ncbi:hypothetical protein HDU67_008576 [Dinochytrium kinnereticum]|nr:hypothetical protein HDU67_008576 [Dinochytrium kinnereticum]